MAACSATRLPTLCAESCSNRIAGPRTPAAPLAICRRARQTHAAAKSSSGVRWQHRQPQQRRWLLVRAVGGDDDELEDTEEPEEIEVEDMADVTIVGDLNGDQDDDDSMPYLPEYLMENLCGDLELVVPPAAGAAEAAVAAGIAEFAGASLSAAEAEALAAEHLPGLARLQQRATRSKGWVEEDSASEDEDELSGLPTLPQRPADEMDVWDLRALMEKRARQTQEWEEWQQQCAKVGMHPTLGADWRSDVRVDETGDPTDPAYREWTNKEIWDLITLKGRNADPRDVPVRIQSAHETADLPAMGGKYVPDMVAWLGSLGRLIDEEDEAAIVDRDGEVALLASEFADFADEEYVAPGAEATEYTADDFGDSFGGSSDDF